ncbi:hypothetical protein [Spirillospora sp. NPDC047279]|uniref:hypothetical protein n=1 Tax=Spirillospora sp. NPDC047279 TaxID=3155478 RepID=UPI0033F7E834
MADRDKRRPEPKGAGAKPSDVAVTGPGRALGEHSWRVSVGAELFWIEETCSCATFCQEETARVWRAVNLCLAGGAVLVSGVAGSMMLAGSRHGVVAGALALVAALLATLIGMLGPARRESQAIESAKAFESVQALARQARQVDLPAQYFEQAREALATLTERWQSVNRSAVPVSRWARLRAGRQTTTEAVEERVTERMSDVVSVMVPAPRTAEQLS